MPLRSEREGGDRAGGVPCRWDSDRRAFLILAAGGLTAPHAAMAAAASGKADGGRDAIIVNALGQLENPNIRESEGAGSGKRMLDRRTLDDALRSGLTAVNCTLGEGGGDRDPYEVAIADIARWDDIVGHQSRQLVKVHAASDILEAKRERKIGIIYGFQDSILVGDRLDRVAVLADLGVRVIQLTYNRANMMGGGSMARPDRGLTDLGRALVARLNDHRIMVDLSHSGRRTCLDAARISARPISINHTGCRALADLPRNKDDEELRAVAEKGGFIGIYFMPFLAVSGHARADDVVAHIEHALNVCGEDHVGIGTDGGTTAIDDMAAYRAQLADEVARRRASGIAATGERADTLPFVADLQGVSQFHDLAARLRRCGHPARRIEKILGRNFLRFAEDIWGA